MSDEKRMSDAQAVCAKGHWCSFCQTWHSSMSCYHPGSSPEATTNADAQHITRLEAEVTRLREQRDALVEAAKEAAELPELYAGRVLFPSSFTAALSHPTVQAVLTEGGES